jgi:hypothetical protein
MVPLVLLLLVLATGTMAAARASAGWRAELIASTVIGVLGPALALALFRNSPNQFVLAATGCILVAPVSVLAYTVAATQAGSSVR